MAELDSEVIEKALIKAEEAARRVIENALGPRASHYNISLSIVYWEGKPERLTVEVQVTRPRAEKEILDEVIEAAIAAAEEVFERELASSMGKGRSRSNP